MIVILVNEDEMPDTKSVNLSSLTLVIAFVI